MRRSLNKIGRWKYLGMTALAVLLVLYLTNVYQKESRFLTKEARYLFINTLEDVRGEALESLLEHYEVDIESDSVTIKSLTKEEIVEDYESRIKVEVFSNVDTILTKDLKGGRRLFRKDATKKGENKFPDAIKNEDSITMIIAQRFGHKLDAAGVDVDFQISYLDSNEFMATLNTLNFDEQFEIKMRQPGWEILGKMWPAILFSLFVFVLIGWAFFALEKGYRNQVQLNEIQEKFIQNVTHELKSPVAAISAAMEALENFDVSSPQKRSQYIRNTRLELDRLNQMIDQIMQSSTAEGQGLRRNYLKNEDLVQLIKDLILRLKNAYPSLTITVDLNQFQIESWLTDREYFSTIVYNVLENSVKYNDKEEVLIKVSSETTEGGLLIYIQDNGPGIDPAMEQHIFERFYRGQKGNLYDVSGYGLGLSLALDCAKSLNGNLRLVSNDSTSDGARFELRLPDLTTMIG